ncbi:MAG: PfkB family carbohydrate kinase [Chitinophagales bacterium]|nr:sugar kinase [Bacteroidota bacterium]MCB9043445.1 sugar kinase [Chitinophagales bacterium]
MSLLTVGTVAFDAIETPFGKTDKIIGGSATYISLSASFFYKKLQIVSVVGDDFPQETIQQFHQKGINTDGLQIIKGEKSFFWSGKYHTDMNSRDTLITDLNVLANFNPVLPETYHQPDYLMLGNIDPVLQLRVLDQLKKRPKLIMIDTMNFWMNTAMETLRKVLTQIDILTINDEEARQLSGEYSLYKAARKIVSEMGPRLLIIKKGEHGALLFNNNHQMFYAPGLPLPEVFDPTGAGDTFAGGFIGHIARSGDLHFDNFKRAVVVGSAMASFCVEKFGPERLLSLTEPEINERIQQFVELAHFDMHNSFF